MVPVVGLEPTRVAPTDFESVTSAIPSHRQGIPTLLVYRNCTPKSRKRLPERTRLSEHVEIMVACQAAGMLDALVAQHILFPGGDACPVPDDLQKEKEEQNPRADQ